MISTNVKGNYGMKIASMAYNFLTSAAVGAVITCIISYVINTKKNHCEYMQQVHT